MPICKRKLFHIVTPPRWKLLTGMALLFLLLAGSWIDAFMDPPNRMVFVIDIVEALFISGVMIASGIHYKFTEDSLVKCFLWIPLRRIRWNRITHALFAHAWADPKTRYQRITNPGAVTGQIIYVTIDGCPRWYPLLTQRWVHHLHHPFRSFTLWLPYSRKNFFVEAFQEHYPELEFQPLDDWKNF